MHPEKLKLLNNLRQAMEVVWKDVQRSMDTDQLDACAKLIEDLTPLLQGSDVKVALAALAYHLDGGIRETFFADADPEPPVPETPEAA